MASNSELAEKDYILGMAYKDIAAKYGVSIETVKSWRKRHSWSRDRTAKKGAPFAPIKNKKGCTPKIRGEPAKEEPDEELSDKEQLFCYHYVRTWNATQAALKSGYTQNKGSAQVLACRLMQRPRVKNEIDRLRKLFRQEIHADIQDFLAFCMKVVGADVGDYLQFGKKEIPVMGVLGPLIDPKTKEPVKQSVSYIDLGESELLDTSVIQEIKQGKDGISIKLADKKWAWEQLIRYFDWLPDKWQRNIDEKRLELENRKVDIVGEKVEGGNKGTSQTIQIIDDIPGGDSSASD